MTSQEQIRLLVEEMVERLMAIIEPTDEVMPWDEDRIAKEVPSPPTRTVAEYEADKAAGINTLYHRLGHTPMPVYQGDDKKGDDK